MVRPIYLDYNGTTPLHPEVLAAMHPFLDTDFGNPSSSHWYGIRPKQAVDEARSQVANLLHCAPGEIIFTSGGTESNNHALRGVARARRDRGNHLITSAIEHPAVLEVCRYLQQEGFEVTYLPVDRYGLVAPEAVERAIRPTTILISIQLANNEVGTIEPIAEIGAIARRCGIALHTDAAQAVGKIPTDVDRLGVDLLSVAGHKLYAPKGVGALYVRPPLRLQNFCFGAGQEMGLRAGTENVLGIVGLGAACDLVGRELEHEAKRLSRLRDRLYEGLAGRVGDLQQNGHPTRRLPNTLSLSFAGLAADRLLEEIGLEVAASAGAACHAATVRISHVLEAMAVPSPWAEGTLRFSLGRMTTAEEIETAILVVGGAVERLRAAG